MKESLTFILPPLAMCLILAGIHCYLGLHVLARGVIFVDLSLAQVASLGTVFAMIMDFDHNSPQSYFISLGSTFVAALIFTYARRAEGRFPQEAIIGITYALATAAVILGIEKMSHGAEHLKESLVGQILWVDWHDVAKVTSIYSVVGLIHFIFRKQFLRNSFQHDEAGKGFIWDFLFYALFGVVITSSVRIAGVLLVFSYLVVPSILSTLVSDKIGVRLVVGWLIGAITSIAGIFLSFSLDLPAGAVIVVLGTSLPILLLPLATRKVTT